MTTDLIPPVSELLARDPFRDLAPADPLALVLVFHQRAGSSACACKAWAAPLGASHADHVAAAIRQDPAACASLEAGR